MIPPKEFRVRRLKIEQSLNWLKNNNPAYSDIIISNERLQSIPEDGQLTDIVTLEFKENTAHKNDKGPSPDQADIGVSQGFTLVHNYQIQIYKYEKRLKTLFMK